MTEQLVYDNYEISGCYRVEDADLVKPGRSFVERCDDDAEAQFWTLYGHIDGQGAQAIGDFTSRVAAEAVYRRIVGEPFTGSYEANPRLRLMHAAPMLLAACEMVTERWETGDLAEAARHCGDAIHEATTACPPWVSTEPEIHQWLARKHQIASIWWIEDVRGIRPDLTCKQAWEVLKAVRQFEDASVGINWDVLHSHAEILFGPSPSAVNADSEEE